MKVKVESPTAEDEADFTIRLMMNCWRSIDEQIEAAALLYRKLDDNPDIDPAVKKEVWFHFSATQRRLMKGALK